MNLPIFALLTGGTITTDVAGIGKGLISGSNLHPHIIKLFNEYSITYKTILNTLSENITLHDLQLIYTELSKYPDEGFCILILHGTDRLTFTAKYLSLTIKPKKNRIFLIGSQRSPEMPTFEGVSKIRSAITNCGGIRPGLYIINHVSGVEETYLDPLSSIKINTYSKNCFTGLINYRVLRTDTTYNIIPTVKPRIYNLAKPPVLTISPQLIQVIAPQPQQKLAQYVTEETKYVLIIGTGLCNIASALIAEITQDKDKVYYVVNDLQGIKQNVYDRAYTTSTLHILAQTVELAYLKLVLGHTLDIL